MNKHQRILLFFAGLFGATSVALAAIGAHAFYATLVANNHVETFGKAVDYAIYGAVALLAVVVLSKTFSSKMILIGGYLLVLGTLLFSGSLFLHTMAGIQALTAITPIGGTTLIIAWLFIAISAFIYRE